MAKVKRKKENDELKFYSLDKIKKCNAYYNIIFGTEEVVKKYGKSKKKERK